MDARTGSRRGFLIKAAALAASAVGVAPGVQAAPQEAADASCLPAQHWGYDLITQLEHGGLNTGCAAGTFGGKDPVSRQKFAWAFRTIFAQLPYCEGAGANLPMFCGKGMLRVVRMLAQGLAPEFATQGIPAAEWQSALARFERLCLARRPYGVTEPVALPNGSYLLDPLWPVDRRVRAEGARNAQVEWLRGNFYLLRAEPPPAEAHTLNAIPLVSVPEVASDPYAAQLLLGHNAEMWRLLRTVGLPRNSRLGWTRDLFRLRSIWSQPDRITTAVHFGRTYVSLDGHFRYNGTRFESNDQPPRQRTRCDASDLDYLRRYGCLTGAYALSWGEPGSGVVYVRCHGPAGARNLKRSFAVDLRTDLILNAEAE